MYEYTAERGGFIFGETRGVTGITARKLEVGEFLRVGDNCVQNFGEGISGEVAWKTDKIMGE